MIDSMPISFPNLGIELDFKNYFTVFGYPIYFYAIILAASLLIAYFYADRRAKKFNITSDDLLVSLLICVPCAIVGARIFYVFFAPEGEITSLADAINIRRGGIALFGVLITTAVVLYFICKKRKILYGNMTDLVSTGFLLAQAIGRWGNFVNREVYGTSTDWLLAMEINGKTHHPLFLYESVWNLIGFIILHNVGKKRKFPGHVTCLYMIWYGIGRAVMESFRESQYVLSIAGLKVSQIVAILFVLVGIFILFTKLVDIKKGEQVSFEYVDKSANNEVESEVDEKDSAESKEEPEVAPEEEPKFSLYGYVDDTLDDSEENNEGTSEAEEKNE